MIGQILEYNTVVTKAEFLFMIQSVNLPPSAHTIQCTLQHTATLCSLQPTIQCTSSAHTAAVITSPVHTAANCSHLQPSTLQLYHPVHTAAILSSAHCSSTIQCTLQLYHPVHTAAIPSSAPCSYTIYTVYPVHLWTTTG